MKRLLLATILLLPLAARAQLKLGNNPTTIDPASILELEDSTRALYLTRVNLISTSDVTTVPNPKAGMVVFNTNGAVNSLPNPIYTANGRGVYYFDGTGWVYSGSGGVGLTNFWSLTGNANAVDGVNFLGTTNNVALNFRVFNNKAGRIDLQGNTLLGYLAGNNLTTGINLNNTLIGSGAGSGITSGVNNVAVGTDALQNNGQGFSNVGVGYRAGATYANTNHNTFLGDSTDITAASINNATAVGAGARVSQSNSVILGNSAASVGIGNTAPTNKLHVTGTDPLRLEGLQGVGASGLSGTDSVLTTTATGVVKKLGVSSVLQPIKANNGLTRVGDSIQLGGTLTKPTSITTNGNNLDLFGTGNLNVAAGVNAGTVTTSTTLAVGTSATVGANLTVGGTVKAAADTVTGNTQTGSLTVVGNTTTGGNTRTSTLTATGILPGLSTDSVLNITTGGVVRKVAPASLPNNIKANNGLTRVVDSIQLGGTLSQNTTIATAGNNLSITGTGNLSVADTASAGALTVGGPAYVNGTTTLVGAATTNGITNTGNISTTGNTSTSTLTATGITQGVSTDSVLNITTGGVVRKVAPASLPNNIKANNGLTRVVDSIQLGGTLSQNTTIATAGNNLSITGTGNLSVADTASAGALTVGGPAYVNGTTTLVGAATTNGITNTGNISTTGNTSTSTLTATGITQGVSTDSVLNITTGGVVRKVAPASLPNNIKANNGLTRVADSIQLGGTLTKATTIDQAGNTLTFNNANITVNGPTTTTGNVRINGNDTVTGSLAAGSAYVTGNTNTNTLTARNLASGSVLDSIVTINAATGVVNKRNVNDVLSTIKANNGLTRVADSIQLGGALTKNTTITQGGNTLTFTGGDISVTGNTTTTGNARINGNDTVTGSLAAGSAYVTGNTNTNTLTARNLASGSVLDSIVTINAATGVVNKRNVNDVLSTIKANNGLTRVADSIQLGGALTKNTTITQGGNTLTFTGGDISVTGNTTTTGNARINGNDTVTGSLAAGSAYVTGNTSTSTLTATGITQGVSTDSVLNITAAGIVRKVAPASLPNNIKANNGLTRVADSIQLGGTLTKATTIDQAGNTLTFNNANITVNGPTTTTGNVRINGNDTVTGSLAAGSAYVTGNTNTNTLTARNLASGSVLDSIVTINAATGIVNKRNVNDVLSTIKANNGLTRVADSIQLGGALTKNTSIQTNGNTLDLFGTGNLNVQDTVSAGSLTAGKAYVSGTTSTDSLSVRNNAAIAGNTKTSTLTATGITVGNVNDSLLNITPAGVVYKVAPASIPNNIKANNGLTRVADSIQLGGTLSKPTTIATSAANTLALTGLQAGASTDSLVTVNTANGQLRRVDINSTGAVTSASNGLTKVGNDIQLGGTLAKPTTINQGIYNLTFGGPLSSGGVSISNNLDAGTLQVIGLSTLNNTQVSGYLTANGTFAANGNQILLNSPTGNVTINNLAAGASTDSIITIDPATNRVRKVDINTLGAITQAANGLTKTGNTVILGGTLNQNTTINTAGNNLNVSGTGNLNVADTVSAGSLTVSGNARVAGNDTVLGNTRLNTLTVTGLTSGSVLDSIVTINNATGVVNKRNVNDVLAAIKANNGLTRLGDSIQLGGTLTKATTIDQAGNTLTFNNANITVNGPTTTNGNVRITGNDTLTGNFTVTGAVRQNGNVTTVGNVNTTGNDTVSGNITAGGAAYVGGNTNTNTLTARNLASGSVLDSIVTINNATGVVNKRNVNDVLAAIKANNGLTRLGDSIQLGGTLTKATTIDQAGNTLTFNNATIAINGNTTTTGNVRVVGNDTVTGNLTANSNGYIGNNLRVAGNDTTTGNLTAGGNGYIGGNMRVVGNDTVGGNITAGGAAYVGGNTNTNTLTARNLASGSVLDSIVTINNATGVVNKRNVNDVLAAIKANNGLTRVADSIQLGGSLTKPTTVTTTATNTLALGGLQSGSLADSIVVADRTTGVLRRLPTTAISNAINANNGLTRLGDSIQLGGNLTKPTAVTTTAANTLALGGLQSGSLADSIVVADRTTGVLRRLPTTAISNAINANNGLTRLGDSIQLGGNLTKPTAVTTTAANTLALGGLQSGSLADSIVVADRTTGVLRRLPTTAISNAINANNGLTRLGDSIQLGGNLTKPTAVTTTAANTLALGGLQSGSLADSIVVADRTTGVLRRLPTTAISNAINANNGLTRLGDSIQLGGNLTKPTAVTTTAANTLALGGLQSGSLADSIVVADRTTGVLRRLPTTAISNAINANNGLTRLGDSIQLGGNLTKPTAVTTTATNTLALGGLQSGSLADSIVVADRTTGVLRRLPTTAISNAINANNGLTRLGDSIQLGGTLTKATTIDQAGNTLTFNNANITVNGPTTTNGNVRITGNDTLTGNFTVTGAVRQNGNVTTVGNVNTTGNDTVSGNITAGGAAYVGGNTNTNTLTARNLASGSVLDSIVTINNATGVVNKRNVNDVLAAIKANNGLTRVADSIQLGGNLTKPTTVTTTAANTLALGGLQSGSLADSIVVADRTTGVLRRLPTTAISNAINANNGLTRLGDSIQLGGNLTKPTTVTTTAANTLALGGLQSGSLADSIVVADRTTGVLRRLPTTAISNAINANNGLTRLGDSIQLGGNLTKPTAVTTTATNTLALGGLQSGSLADSIVVADRTTGVLRRLPTTAISNAINANNGLTRLGDSIQLGGNLTKPTAVTTTATNTLALGGLQSGSLADSIVVADRTTGVLRRLPTTAISNAINANNGLTRLGDSIQLGGNLTKPTTVTTTATNTLALGGLQSGSLADSIVVADRTTGVLRRLPTTAISNAINANNGLTRLGDSIQLGGNLTKPTTVTTTAANTLAVSGLSTVTGTPTTPVVVQSAGGVLQSSTLNSLGAITTASNGIVKSGNNVALGGMLDSNTTINTGNRTLTIGGSGSSGGVQITNGLTTGDLTVVGLSTLNNTSINGFLSSNGQVTLNNPGSNLTINNLPNGASTDSIVTINPLTNRIRQVNINTLGAITAANNGLSKTGNTVQLGGSPLIQPTTIATGGNDLSFTGTGNLNVADTVSAGSLMVGGNARVAGNDTVLGNTRLNTLTVTGLTSGSVLDSIVTINNATGVVNKRNVNDLLAAINANNGLTRLGDSIQLGGNLTKPTTVTTTAANTLALGGLQSGSLADSIVVADRTTGVLRRLPTTAISNAINANNGLTRLGDSIQLGGNLTKPTAVTTTATNTLALGGLQSGSLADSIVVADRTTGVLRRLPTTAISNAINANNGLTRLGDSIQLGGTLTKPTAVTTTAANTLALGGLQSGSLADSIVVADRTTGVLRRLPTTAISNAINANNGLTRLGDSIQLGGNLTKPTTVTTTAANTLALGGLQSGSLADSIVVADRTTGVLRRLPTTAISNAINANNGLTRLGDSIQLGGNLTKPTAVTTTAANTLALGGLQSGSLADSIVVADRTTGVLRRLPTTAISNAINANNGLTRLGDSIQLGGNLTKPTTVTTTAANTLALGGLQSGSLADSIVVADRTTGVLRRLPTTAISNAINANNGLTRLGDSIQLGGNLTKPTAVTTTAANTLALGGLQSGSLADSIVVADRTTGVLRRLPTTAISNAINANNGLTRLGDSIQLGGNLTKPTAVTTTAANTLALGGLQSGSLADSIVVADRTTGVLRRLPTTAISNAINANNGLTRLGDSIQLGGTLTKATTIDQAGNTLTFNNATIAINGNTTTTGNVRVVGNDTVTGNLTANSNGYIGNNLRVAGNDTTTGNLTAGGNGYIGGNMRVVGNDTTNGNVTVGTDAYVNGNTNVNTLTARNLASGSVLDSIVTINNATGVVNKRNVNDLLAAIKANNGLTRLGDSIQLGGNLTKPTAVTTTAANTLALGGLQSGSLADSIVVADRTTGVLRRLPTTAISNAINANNGLTRLGDSIQLGGNLTKPTTVTTTAANTLALGGLQSGSLADSIVVADRTTGVLRRLPTTAISNAINANNGLTRLGDSIQLGGTLTKPTTVTTTATNTLALGGLQSGSLADSIVVADRTTGVLRRLPTTAISNAINANNGLTRLGDSIQLGGTLTKPTTVTTTATNTLALGGLQSGSLADSIVVADRTTGVLRRLPTTAISNAINANNGLTRLGDSIQLGGNLTKPTTVTTTAANTLALGGLQSGSLADSIVVADRTTGVLRRLPTTAISNAINANNGLTRLGDSIQLGGTLTKPTAVTTTAANTLALGGLQSGSLADSIVVADRTTGVLRRLPTTAISNAINANNGLTRLGDSIQLGGTLTKPTAVTTTAANTLALGGLQSGSLADSIVVADRTTGVLRRLPTTAISNAINANNGLTRLGDSIQLGGTLTKPTTVTTTATNTLALGGLQSGSLADSIVVADRTTGVLRRLPTTAISNAINANNGLTRLGDSIQLGGTLTKPTAVTTTAANTLALGGLQSGSLADSIVVADRTTGVLRRLPTTAISNAINANNGLTRLGDSIQLGGTLTKPTAVTTTAANTLALGGLQSGSLADSIVVADRTTGVLRRLPTTAISNAINANNGLTRLGDSIQLGGNLTKPTAVTTTAANTLALGGLQSGSLADSIVVADRTTGVLRRLPTTAISNAINANNGLTRLGDSIQLGGTLSKNTVISTSNSNFSLTLGGPGGGTGALIVSGTISAGNNVNAANDINASGNANITAQTSTNTLKIGTTSSAAATDSILTVDPSTRIVKSRTVASLAALAGSGLTNNTTTGLIDLGGTLTHATGIANGGNDITVTGSGNLSVQDTVAAGALVVNGPSYLNGALRVTGNTNTSTLTATGITNTTNVTDSLLNISSAGVVSKVAPGMLKVRILTAGGPINSNDQLVMINSSTNPTPNAASINVTLPALVEGKQIIINNIGSDAVNLGGTVYNNAVPYSTAPAGAQLVLVAVTSAGVPSGWYIISGL